MGTGSESGLLRALSIVIDFILANSSSEMSAFERYSGLIAAICIATFLLIATNSSLAAVASSTSNAARTPTEPPA